MAGQILGGDAGRKRLQIAQHQRKLSRGFPRISSRQHWRIQKLLPLVVAEASSEQEPSSEVSLLAASRFVWLTEIGVVDILFEGHWSSAAVCGWIPHVQVYRPRGGGFRYAGFTFRACSIRVSKV